MRLIDADALMEHPVWLCGGWAGDSYAEGYMDALDKVEETVKLAPTIDVPLWIPCEERLPEKNGAYLATIQSKYDTTVRSIMFIRYDTAMGFENLLSVDVTAWMPLPEVYVGERKDDDTD